MALYVVDISSWQALGAGDGFDGVVVKATEGGAYGDPRCDAHYQRAKSRHQRRGVYHFARPDLNPNGAIEEADFFVDNCQGYIKDGILVLDFECAVWNVAWAKTWLDRVYSRTGVRPLIYMSASVVNSYDWSSVANAGYGLWIAGYPNKYNVPNPPRPDESELPYAIGAWPFAAMWQYSSSAGALDRDIFYGDVNAWNAYAGRNITSSKPKEEPKEKPKKPEEKPKEEPKEEPKEDKKDDNQTQDTEHSDTPAGATPDKETEDHEKVPQQPDSTDKGFSTKDYLEIVEKAKQSVELVEKTAKQIDLKVPMSNKVYDALKVVVAIVLPTISTLYLGLAAIWGFGFGEQVDQTIQLIIAAINAVLGIAIVKSSSDYHKGDLK